MHKPRPASPYARKAGGGGGRRGAAAGSEERDRAQAVAVVAVTGGRTLAPQAASGAHLRRTATRAGLWRAGTVYGVAVVYIYSSPSSAFGARPVSR